MQKTMHEITNKLEFLEKISEFKVTNFCKDGKCSCCGECCSDMLPLSDAEIIKIKKYIKKNNIKMISHKNVLEINKQLDWV